MKQILLLVSLIFVFAFYNAPSATAEQTLKFIVDKEEPGEFELISSTVQKYEQSLVKAINENRYSTVEPYLMPGSNLYYGQKDLVKQLYRKGIKERYVSCEVIDCELIDPGKKYKAYVNVIVGIIQQGKPEIKEEFYWIYTIEKWNSGFALSNIEEWTDYRTHMANAAACVKADGYYAMELIRYYGGMFLDATNTLNITALKMASGNKRVLETQKKMITRLRKIDSHFTIVGYEFTPSNELCSNCHIKMVFKAAQSAENAPAIELNYQLMLKEIRKGFGGYAVITEMKEIK